MFKIAERFTPEVRRKVAAMTFEPAKGFRPTLWRTTLPDYESEGRNFCPLGAMLVVAGFEPVATDPSPAIVARTLMPLGRPWERMTKVERAGAYAIPAGKRALAMIEYQAVMREARSFIRAWDKNKVTDLAASLGVDGVPI
jgi:hypothetical protein